MTEHKAGRELDAVIAERVMGFKITGRGDDLITYRHIYEDGKSQAFVPVPAYSTNIADAWLVIERMKADGWHYEIGDRHSDLADCVTFGRGDYDRYDGVYEYEVGECVETVPLAICLAALRAIDATA